MSSLIRPHDRCLLKDFLSALLISISFLSGYGFGDASSATLTPMHLRKAKLMFFWVRYPSSAILKMYFPDIKFNKNNTAQLVKWFSNFRYVFFWFHMNV